MLSLQVLSIQRVNYSDGYSQTCQVSLFQRESPSFWPFLPLSLFWSEISLFFDKLILTFFVHKNCTVKQFYGEN